MAYPPPGKLYTLAASAARTASANGSAVYVGSHRRRVVALLDIADSATAAGDTCDVYVDVSLDGSTWLNAIHFTQQAGNASDVKRFAVLDSTSPGTTDVAVATDANSGAVRPALIGPYLRARWALVDGGEDANTSHTFSVVAFVS